MKVGFSGLGQMGRPIAHNLLKSGATLVVSARTDRWFAEFEAMGASAITGEAGLADSDVIFLCLPNAEVVQQVLTGEDGLLARLKPGQVVVDLSTITYSATAELGQAARGTRRRVPRCADLRHGGSRRGRHAERDVRRRAGRCSTGSSRCSTVSAPPSCSWARRAAGN